MKKEENSVNKYLYKVFLYLIKIIPMVIAVLFILNSVLSYFDIDVIIFSYIGGISVLPLLFFYLTSYVFNFCNYHRMFLHYISITWAINIIDCCIGIPLNSLNYLCLQMIIAGIFLFIILYLYVTVNKKDASSNSR